VPALPGRAIGRLRRLVLGGREVRLEWDAPPPDTETIGEPFRLSGWAYAKAGLEAVSVQMNGGVELQAVIGLPRNDVARALETPAAAQSGWSLTVPVSLIQPGENSIEVIARAADDRRASVTRTLRWRELAEGENPYEQVDLTGERYDPRYPHMNSVAVEHRARYLLAASLAPGRRVVDVGCGLGYGTATLADAGAVVVEAIDASRPAIEIARRDHGRDDVRYTIGDIRKLPYGDASFDLAVCFEVIEHIVEHDQLLDELRRVLSPDGLLVLSTPNRGQYPADNPWHVRELTTGELAQALGERFANVALLGQQLHLASLLGDAAVHERADPTASFTVDALKLSGSSAGSEVYVVALASDASLPPTRPLVAIGDPRDELADAAIESWCERALVAEAEAAMLRTRLEVARQLGIVPVHEVADPPPVPPAGATRAALRRELTAPPPWMYAWDLGPVGRVADRFARTQLESIHRTRLELVEPAAIHALAEAGPDARVLDLGCCEGWFGHRLLELGAGSVVGVDIREVNVRRARLVRDHLGIDPARLEFHQADVFALPDLGRFDVVLMLGLIYHLENPMAAMRIARALTKSVCFVESQLTEQRTPIMAGNGGSGVHFERPESFAAWFEEDQEENPLASFGRVLSLVPNEAALLLMGRVAGFSDVRIAPASADHDPAYVRRERAVMIARTGGAPAAAPDGQ
jgi:2-polyprenyl-3-methyl-5-hydroxy-6-metoxy-1,4-benzoquinol methylase